MVISKALGKFIGLLILSALVLAQSLFAESYTYSFYDNKVSCRLQRISVDGQSLVRLDITAPQSTKTEVRTLSSPPRVMVKMDGAHVLRTRSHAVPNDPLIGELRVAARPSELWVTLEFHTKELPFYTTIEHANTLTILASEREGISPPAAFETLRTKLTEGPGERGVWPLTRVRPKLPFDLDVDLWNKTTGDLKEENKTESQFSNHSELTAKATYDLPEDIRAVVSGRYNYFTYRGSDDPESFGEWRLRDTYVDVPGEFTNVRVGNQVVRWGKADEISPLDNINPEDYRDGPVRRRTDRKIPIPIANLDVTLDPIRTQFIFSPGHYRSRIRSFNEDWAIFGNGASEVPIDEDNPGSSWDNSMYGGRVSTTIDALDISVSALSKVSDTPSLKSFSTPPGFAPLSEDPVIGDMPAFAAQSGQPIGLEYVRKEIYGAEFETVWDTLGLRGDFAATQGEPFLTDSLQAVERDSYRWVLGGDYHSASDFYANVQVGQNIISGSTAELLYYDKTNTNLYSEISQELWDNDLKFGIRGLYEIDQEGFFYNPYTTLGFWEDISFEFGFEVFGGPQNGLTGFYDNNDVVYLTMDAYL